MQPKFSIVMPIYGVEKYLTDSIQSVLCQTFEDYELILVDDESPDNCPQMCDEYAMKYDNIKVIHQKNTGLAGARNTGIRNAQGEYVYCLDSDDTIQPDTLDYFNRIIERYPEAKYIFSDYQGVEEAYINKPTSYDYGCEVLTREQIQELFLKRQLIILAPDSLLNLKWLRDNNLAYESNPYGEDQLFIWKALLRVDKVYHIRKPLYNYLHRPGSIMTASKTNKIIKAYPYFQDLEKMYQESPDAIPIVKKYLLPFWVRGILHSSAKICSYDDYAVILNVFESNRHCRALLSFPDLKIRVVSLLFFVSRRLYYAINRIM